MKRSGSLVERCGRYTRQPGSVALTFATCSLSSAASASPLPFAARIFATTVNTSAMTPLLLSDQDLLHPAAALGRLDLHEAILLLAHEDQLLALGQRGHRRGLVGRLSEELDVADLRAKDVAFVEDRACLRRAGRLLGERADLALQARVVPHGAHDAVVVVGEACRDNLALGCLLVAAETAHETTAAEDAAQPEVSLLRAALGCRDLQARARVGQQHAGLRFLELEPARHSAEHAAGRAERA